MPKFLEDRLKSEAAKKGFRGKRAARYVYGTMQNLGYMRGSKETAAGRNADRKHQRDIATARRTGRTVAAAGAARRRHSRRGGRS